MRNLRAIAAQKLALVFQRKHSLDTASDPFVSELSYGVCRFYFRLDRIARQLLKKPLKSSDLDIYALILIGIYQLDYMHLPKYAILSETVEATLALNKAWAKGLVNAVLRNYLRNKTSIAIEINASESAKLAHPLWFIEKIKQHYPKEAESIFFINNQRAPMSLRVNTRLISAKAYLKKLADQHIEGECYTESGVILKQPVSVDDLPGFSVGEVSVQDISAQAIVPLLDLKPNQRVLDACAAPGGKTLHILETEPQLAELIALDRDARRLTKVQENLDRHPHLSGVSIRLIASDASEPNLWWDGKLFDRILVDAPCSGTGVIRRHPDIKFLRTPDIIKQLVHQQQKILNALWPLLQLYGKLVYATCSILPEENRDVIRFFLDKASDAHVLDSRQILPSEQQDGFFYAVMQKLKK